MDYKKEIDYLGRFVIPKEIRKMLNIKDGDILSITANVETGEIILKNTTEESKGDVVDE